MPIIKKYQKILLRLGVWLIIIIAAAVAIDGYYYRLPKSLIYASEPYQTRGTLAADGFTYLNQIRQSVGIRPFAPSKTLTLAATRHARYLQHHPSDGHQERRSSSPYFSGTTTTIRTAGAGYVYFFLQE